MGQQVILLRGINVGGHGKLPMAELKVLLETLGAKRVRTYIQSGNVVVDSAPKEFAISEAIFAAKGFLPLVSVIEEQAFRAIANAVPFEEPDGKLCHIWFPTAGFTFNQEKAGNMQAESENLLVTANAIYLHAPDGIGRSKLAAKIESLAGLPCTARNMNTVNKLIDMLANPA